jgi:hypothetical protein
LPTRSLVFAGALLPCLALGACQTAELHPPDHDAGVRPNRWIGSFDPLHRNVDVLFLIDDSSGMAVAQDNLIRNFPTFMAALQADPAGLPNLHIGVVSADMGAGDGSIPGCNATGGKNGIFQYTARGACSETNLQLGATFISNVNGFANYAGNIEDVFGCIAALGEAGCGFEHQFAAIERALGVDGLGPPPAENSNFLRDEAALAVVMLTNEDDCSASTGDGPNRRIPLFDTDGNMGLNSQLGPPINFRCNEFGHLCRRAGGSPLHPDREAPNADLNAAVAYDDCESNDSEGYLLATVDTANRIKSLKADPSRVAVASIQGPPTPYAVHWSNPPSTDTTCYPASCPWPAVTHTCTAADGRTGDPGVRTAQLARAFGRNGVQLSVCDDSFGPGLEGVATMINELLGPACIPGPIGLNAAGQPDCKVELTNGTVGWVATVAACADNGGVAPCWQLATTAACSGQTLEVSPDPNVPASSTSVFRYDCAK